MFGKIIDVCVDKRTKQAVFVKYSIINVKSGGV